MLQTCERKMEPCMKNEAVQNIKGINKCQMERKRFIFTESIFFYILMYLYCSFYAVPTMSFNTERSVLKNFQTKKIVFKIKFSQFLKVSF